MIEEGSEFLGRSCADCLKFMWSDEGVTGKNRKKYKTIADCVEATGQEPWRRVSGTLPPCYKCPKISKDAPEKSYYFANELTERTWQTIEHYEQCEAVNDFPRDAHGEIDPIVKRNAAIIRKIRDIAKETRSNQMIQNLMTIFMGKR